VPRPDTHQADHPNQSRHRNTRQRLASLQSAPIENSTTDGMTKEITLRITLQGPTPGVVYGLQKGKGAKNETIQKQTSDSTDLVFQFQVEARLGDNGQLILLGPFTQGTPRERFVYIDIGTCAGQKDSPWSRRLKIPLSGIDAELLNSLPEKNMLCCEVPGAGKDGGPNCATVKPFSGWKGASAH
jgi:hypothetical protein